MTIAYKRSFVWCQRVYAHTVISTFVQATRAARKTLPSSPLWHSGIEQTMASKIISLFIYLFISFFLSVWYFLCVYNRLQIVIPSTSDWGPPLRRLFKFVWPIAECYLPNWAKHKYEYWHYHQRLRHFPPSPTLIPIQHWHFVVLLSRTDNKNNNNNYCNLPKSIKIVWTLPANWQLLVHRINCKQKCVPSEETSSTLGILVNMRSLSLIAEVDHMKNLNSKLVLKSFNAHYLN